MVDLAFWCFIGIDFIILILLVRSKIKRKIKGL